MEVVTATYGVDQNTTILDRWLGWSQTAGRFVESDNVKKLKMWIRDQKEDILEGVPVIFLLTGDEYAGARLKAVNDLI